MHHHPRVRLSITIAIAICVWLGAGASFAQVESNPDALLLPEWMLAPRAVTGQVSITRFRCVTAPCPPPVVLVDDQVIAGPLAADLLAFEDEYVTVRGVDTQETSVPALSVFRGESFTPDPDPKLDFITGQIEVSGGVVEVHTATGKVYKIVGSASREALLRAHSAHVTLYGKISKVGARARVQDFEIHSSTFMARGDLHRLMRAMGAEDDAIPVPPSYISVDWPDYVLQIPSGKSFPIFGELESQRAGDGETRWLTIDARDMSKLRATHFSKPYHPIGIDPVWPLPVPVIPSAQPFGDNSKRGDNTVHSQAAMQNLQDTGFAEPHGMERD